ncbi:outer membrane protein assembly factor BamB family protein [Lignipirellula cremea]|uniref:Outer membrane protein assembly factor BamB n=1 Tax=Lignipirellula cremea TaxID=2528010 RepID=A0A518DSC0_9BACT|nr:PQQ-binding-like beta-propeller repeat protein [Lignipirellula cremea]QDU94729.1 Outer membrane protein assembly factor BamB [Lignipirellula cremea]
MSASQFLDALAEQGLLEEKVLAKLRKQVASSAREIPPKEVAALLIDKGHLTPFLAKKILSSLPPDTSAVEDLSATEEMPVVPPQGGGEQPVTPPGKGEQPLAPPPAPGKQPAAEQPLAGPPQAAGGKQPAAEQPLAGPSKAAPAPTAQPPVGDEDDLTLRPEDDDLTPLEDDDLTPIGDDDLTPIGDDDLTPIGGDDLTPIGGDYLVPVSGDDLTPMGDGLTPLPSSGLTPLPQGGGSSGLTPLPSGPSGLDYAEDPFANQGQQQSRPEPSRGTSAKKKPRESQWESPLLFGGGLLLLVLIVSGGFLGYAMLRGNSTEMLEHAEQLYSQQSYSQAIEAYDEFLEAFPSDPKAGLARVHRGMAALRNDVENKSEMLDALHTAQKILPEIEVEEELSLAHPELAGLLPTIAEGFVAQAQATAGADESEKHILNAKAAIELVNNGAYMPTSVRKNQENRIERILEDIRREEREISRDRELVTALAAIEKAVEANDTPAAYEVRKQLIRAFNDLETNEQLDAAVHAISERERDLVQVKPQSLEPQPVAPSPALSQIMLVSRSGEGLTGVDGQVVAATVNGVAYGFRAGDGGLLWRRPVGLDSEFQPLRVSAQPGADLLLVDTRDNSLLRVQAASGEVVWGLPIGERFLPPIVTPDSAVLTTPGGKIMTVDLQTGTSSVVAQLPQGTPTPAGYSDQRPQLYQTGEHSNLYVLSPQDLRCREVFYLGHKAGAVVTPPVVQKGYLFVADNAGSDYSLLHVLETNTNGLELKAAQPPIRLPGKVLAPPQIYNRNVLVVTDLGAIFLFEVDGARIGSPAKAVVESVPRMKTSLLNYPVAAEGKVWVADRRLSSFDILVARGQLSTARIGFQEDVFVAPLQMINDAVVHVRRKRNSPAFSVAASRDPLADPVWEVNLAPLAGLPIFSPKVNGYLALSAEGRRFQLPAPLPGGFSSETYNITKGDLPSDTPFAYSVPVNDDTIAYASSDRGDLILVSEVAQGEVRLRKRLLTAPKSAPPTPPLPFAGGMLSPNSSGQVFLFNAAQGDDLATPFQPPVAPGALVQWRRPALLSDTLFAIADDRKKIYLVEVSDDARKSLVEKKLIDTGASIVSPLAAIDASLFGVLRGGSSDILTSYELPSLKLANEHDLGDRVTWGPYVLDNTLLLTTSGAELLRFDAASKLLWKTPNPFGPPLGEPLLLPGGDLLLATAKGDIWRVAAADGNLVAHVALQEPIAAPPKLLDTGLLLTGPDGVVYLLPVPGP